MFIGHCNIKALRDYSELYFNYYLPLADSWFRIAGHTSLWDKLFVDAKLKKKLHTLLHLGIKVQIFLTVFSKSDSGKGFEFFL